MALFKKRDETPSKPVKPTVSAKTIRGRQALNDRLQLQRKLDKDGNIK